MATCPTCDQPIPHASEAEKLLAILTDQDRHRQVYRGQDGGWYVTYGGGPFTERSVRLLVDGGKLNSVYSNAPNDAYHVGKTWDYERTMEARKKLGKKAPNYFVGDPA